MYMLDIKESGKTIVSFMGHKIYLPQRGEAKKCQLHFVEQLLLLGPPKKESK